MSANKASEKTAFWLCSWFFCFWLWECQQRQYLCVSVQRTCFWKYTAITLWLGWWGLRTFFMPLILIPANIINYIRAGELRKSSDQLSGIAVGWKLAIVTVFSPDRLFVFCPA
jgi:hypothetical protein